MFVRLASLLAALAVVVWTAAAFVHAPVAGAPLAFPGQSDAVMQLAGGDPHGCDGPLPCASADDGACEMLCAGVSTLLPEPADTVERSFAPVIHDRPAATVIAGQVPGLRKRPPIL